MSDNKLNYFTVTTTTVVQAKNKTEALALSMNRRGIAGRTLSTLSEVERIRAAEARSVAQSA